MTHLTINFHSRQRVIIEDCRLEKCDREDLLRMARELDYIREIILEERERIE